MQVAKDGDGKNPAAVFCYLQILCLVLVVDENTTVHAQGTAYAEDAVRQIKNEEPVYLATAELHQG